MSAISASEALRYATDGEMLKLYAVLAGGRTLMMVGESTARTVADPVVTLVALLALVVGVVALLGAIVAIARKVLAES